MKTLWGERRLVVPVSKISISYKKDGTHKDTAEGYAYDDIGNLTKQTRYGFVQANITDGTFIDIPGDESIIESTYTANLEKNILRLPVSQKIYGLSGELLSFTQKEYDGQSSGATFGLVTASIQR